MSIQGLPSKEFSFNIDVMDSDGVQRTGSFTYVKPNLKTKTEIEKTIARLSEGLPLSRDMELIHRILATLSHTLTHYPKWWEEKEFGFTFDDSLVAIEIFSKIQDFEEEYFNSIFGKQEEVVESAKKAKNEKDKREKAE